MHGRGTLNVTSALQFVNRLVKKKKTQRKTEVYLITSKEEMVATTSTQQETMKVNIQGSQEVIGHLAVKSLQL